MMKKKKIKTNNLQFQTCERCEAASCYYTCFISLLRESNEMNIKNNNDNNNNITEGSYTNDFVDSDKY